MKYLFAFHIHILHVLLDLEKPIFACKHQLFTVFLPHLELLECIYDKVNIILRKII